MSIAYNLTAFSKSDIVHFMNLKAFLATIALLSLIFTTKALADGGQTGETACTPVYGMANTCIEHQVVDTGVENSIFYTLSAGSYLAGLAAFIKAKLVG